MIADWDVLNEKQKNSYLFQSPMEVEKILDKKLMGTLLSLEQDVTSVIIPLMA